MDVIRKIIRGVVGLILIGVLSLGCTVWLITTPELDFPFFEQFDSMVLDSINDYADVYDDGGKLLFQMTKNGKTRCDIEMLPKHVSNAFLAIEDARFYTHGAIDPQRLAAAALKNILAMKAKEGGSTLTQQLAKITYLSQEKTFTRKIKELRIAREIEKKYTKSQILEFYLNSLYFGRGAYGISQASERFFQKEAAQLSIGEAALLAAIINNPKNYDPISKYEKAIERQQLVIRRMKELRFISDTESIQPPKVIASAFGGHYCAQLLSERFSEGKIYTRINNEIQQQLILALNEIVGESESLCASIVYDSKEGGIVAAATNADENIAALRRQPGSTIKPFICFAPALESGLINPLSQIFDAPTSFGEYSPKNHNNKYYGWISAEDSLALSLNIPAVKLLEVIGIEYAKGVAESFGIIFDEEDCGLALALGGMKYGVPLFDITRAYSLLSASEGAVKADTKYFLQKMLKKSVTMGTAKQLCKLKNIAAKTGTVGTKKGNTDAYTIAFNNRYVVSVWIGSRKGVMQENETGGDKPARVCAKVFENPNLQTGAFIRPKSIINVELDIKQLERNHRLVRANGKTLPKDRVSAEFSVYCLPEGKNKEDLSCGDYDDFKIVDSFVD